MCFALPYYCFANVCNGPGVCVPCFCIRHQRSNAIFWERECFGRRHIGIRFCRRSRCLGIGKCFRGGLGIRVNIRKCVWRRRGRIGSFFRCLWIGEYFRWGLDIRKCLRRRDGNIGSFFRCLGIGKCLWRRLGIRVNICKCLWRRRGSIGSFFRYLWIGECFRGGLGLWVNNGQCIRCVCTCDGITRLSLRVRVRTRAFVGFNALCDM